VTTAPNSLGKADSDSDTKLVMRFHFNPKLIFTYGFLTKNKLKDSPKVSIIFSKLMFSVTNLDLGN